MPEKKISILLVEDEENLQEALKLNLELEDYEVTVADNGLAALDAVQKEHFDLMILDVMLPELDGISVCENIRLQNNDIPILILSAKSSSADRVLGLKKGADDYLTKPFSNDELQARVRACLRRARVQETNTDNEPEVLMSEDGHIHMDIASRQVRVGSQEVRLTPTEFELLRQLMLYAGKVLTHRSLLRAVWGPEYGEEADYLRVYVRQLRLKVETEPSRPRYILTEPGISYVFRSSHES